jgi:CheY-like chemotaxis protein
MPGEDGYSLIRKLRAMNAPGTASIPAVALTAFAREEDRQEALQAGFQLHLAKPIEPRSLVAAVAKVARLTPV